LRSNRLDIGRETARFAPAVSHLAEVVAVLLPPGERLVLDRREARLTAAGVPQELAARVAGLIFLTTAFEVGDLAERSGRPVDRAAQTFYGVGAHFALDEMRDAARRLPAETPYQKAATETLIDDFYSVQAELATRVLAAADGATHPLATWIGGNASLIGPAEAVAAEMRSAAAPDLAMLVVASRQLRQVLALREESHGLVAS